MDENGRGRRTLQEKVGGDADGSEGAEGGQRRQLRARAEGEGEEVRERGDGDGDARLAHCARHALAHGEIMRLGVEGAHEHKHVVDADADQNKRQHVDHGVELEADEGREAVRECDRQADRGAPRDGQEHARVVG